MYCCNNGYLYCNGNGDIYYNDITVTIIAVLNITIKLFFVVTIIGICTVAIMLIFTTTTMVMVWCGAGDVLGGAEPPGRLLVQGGPGRPHGQRQRIDSTCTVYCIQYQVQSPS
jgi:hypothetical protein